MIEYRCFRNEDPPRLADAWRAAALGQSAVQPMTTSVLEAAVFSKPYFDRQGLIVAVDEGRVVIPVLLLACAKGEIPIRPGARYNDVGLIHHSRPLTSLCDQPPQRCTTRNRLQTSGVSPLKDLPCAVASLA